MINILLVDKQKIFRECLKCFLESNNNLINVIGDVSSFSECIDIIRSNNVDLIILDNDVDNSKIIEFVSSKNILVHLLVLSGSIDIASIFINDKLSVDGYLLKDCFGYELMDSINDVISGNQYFSVDIIPFINNYLINKESDKDKIDLLTNRELELLKKIAIGYKNIEIANDMNISERTVKNHLTHIFDKIGVKDRTQAAVFAIKNNIVSL